MWKKAKEVWVRKHRLLPKHQIEILRQNIRGKMSKSMKEKCKHTLNHTEGWKRNRKSMKKMQKTL